jgi:hypothetical protein
MGNYQAPCSVFQWLLKQGDSSLVGGSNPIPPVNQPPVVILTPAIDTLILPSDSLTILENKSFDPDGTIIACTWQQILGIPVNISVGANNGATISGFNTPGNYSFQANVTDNSGTTSSAIANVIVLPPKTPQPPVATIVGTTSVVGTADTLTVNIIDPSGKIVQWGWGKISGNGTQTISGASTSRVIITGLQNGAYAFKVTVWSSSGLTGSAIINLNILRTITKVMIYYSDGTIITQQ